MNKLGFIVGHPTQFEGPMYQYFNKWDNSFLKVYFFEGVKTSFNDKELSIHKNQTWGIDINSGYNYVVLNKMTFKTLTAILNDNKYIIVNGYMNKFSIFLMLFGKIKNKNIGLRLDTVQWNNTNIFKKIYKRILIRMLNNLVDTYWVVGSKSRDYLLYNGVEKDRIKYLSYVVDNGWFRKESNLSVSEKSNLKKSFHIPETSKVVLCVSKLVDRELPIDVIDALEKINNPNICLLIAGDGNKREFLENYAKSKIISKNIIFIGYVNYTDLPSIYAICDLFIHPSKNEPWGVSIQEAMACGKPVIASNFVGAGFDLIREAKNGFTYNFNDIEDLANKIDMSLTLFPEEVNFLNNSILEFWDYKTAFKLINEHIDN